MKTKFGEYYEIFNNTGYFLYKNSVEKNIIDEALDDIERFKVDNITMWNRNIDENGYLRRLTNLHRYGEKISKLFTNNKTIYLADYIFQNKTSIYTSLYFEAASEQDIHRDTPYFHTNPINKFLGFWVALEDVSLMNGPLKLIPKGHLSQEQDLRLIANQKYDDLNQIDPNDPDLWAIYQEKMHKQCKNEGLSEIKVEMKKGDTLIWHPMLPHGGSEILNKSMTRNSIVFHVTPENMPVYKQDAFFNPEKICSLQPSWGYIEKKGRKIAQIGNTVLFPNSFKGVRDEVDLDVVN